MSRPMDVQTPAWPEWWRSLEAPGVGELGVVRADQDRRVLHVGRDRGARLIGQVGGDGAGLGKVVVWWPRMAGLAARIRR